MSTPIRICTMIKAARGDEAAFDGLVAAMFYNQEYGAFTLLPCEHKPSCKKPTEKQIKDLDARLCAEMSRRQQLRKET